MASGFVKPFTPSEHDNFMEALERCADDDVKTVNMWQELASCLNKTTQEVKLHAHQYLLRLQAETQGSTPKASFMGPLDDGTWTKDEDSLFEHGIATFNEGDPERWRKILKLLPHKTEEQIKRRYQKLLFDVSRIECGHQVILTYKPSEKKPTQDPPLPPPIFTSKEMGLPTSLTSSIPANPELVMPPENNSQRKDLSNLQDFSSNENEALGIGQQELNLAENSNTIGNKEETAPALGKEPDLGAGTGVFPSNEQENSGDHALNDSVVEASIGDISSTTSAAQYSQERRSALKSES